MTALVESRSTVRDLPQIVADMELELSEEIRAIDEQLSASRNARMGNDMAAVAKLNAMDESESIGPDDVDQDSIMLLEEVLALLDQAVSQYNEAVATHVEGAADALDDARKALKDGQEELEQRKAEQDSKKVASTTAPPSSDSPAPRHPNMVPHTTPSTLSHTVSPPPAASQSQLSANSSLFKGGMMLNLGKERFLRSFANQYIVVSDGQTPGTIDGIAWYESEAAFLKKAKPIDSIPFFTVTQNSRGSRFKKASVCWPHLTSEDCPKISSVKGGKSFFAVDNVAAAKNELIVFAAGSDKERDEWVFFITKFVALYLPPGEEFEAFVDTPVGATKPIHVSHVLDGEAPGSAQRVV